MHTGDTLDTVIPWALDQVLDCTDSKIDMLPACTSQKTQAHQTDTHANRHTKQMTHNKIDQTTFTRSSRHTDLTRLDNNTGSSERRRRRRGEGMPMTYECMYEFKTVAGIFCQKNPNPTQKLLLSWLPKQYPEAFFYFTLSLGGTY